MQCEGSEGHLGGIAADAGGQMYAMAGTVGSHTCMQDAEVVRAYMHSEDVHNQGTVTSKILISSATAAIQPGGVCCHVPGLGYLGHWVLLQ